MRKEAGNIQKKLQNLDKSGHTSNIISMKCTKTGLRCSRKIHGFCRNRKFQKWIETEKTTCSFVPHVNHSQKAENGKPKSSAKTIFAQQNNVFWILLSGIFQKKTFLIFREYSRKIHNLKDLWKFSKPPNRVFFATMGGGTTQGG